jgi:hypothetical protein
MRIKGFEGSEVYVKEKNKERFVFVITLES